MTDYRLPYTGAEFEAIINGIPTMMAQYEEMLVKINQLPNLASYIAFCGNVNATQLDSAFGKNNEDYLTELGKQMALYSWFKGDSRVIYPYVNLFDKDTLELINQDSLARAEAIGNPNIKALIEGSPFALDKIKPVKWLYNEGVISDLAGDFLLTGVSGSPAPTLTKGASSMTLASSYDAGVTLIAGNGTCNSINTESCTKLYFLVSSVYVAYSGSSLWVGYDNIPLQSIVSNLTDTWLVGTVPQNTNIIPKFHVEGKKAQSITVKKMYLSDF